MTTVTTKLFVGNLPETCRKYDFQRLFEKYGKVVECDIVKNYGFVHFEDDDEAKVALDELNNSEFEGHQIKVELSHSKVRQKPGMGGKGECYRCGKEGHWSKDCPKGPTRPRKPMDKLQTANDPYGNFYRYPFMDPYRDRYPPPPPPPPPPPMPNPPDRYRPYPDPYERRTVPPLPPPRDGYGYRLRDPYERPPPEYYGRRMPQTFRDPYYDSFYDMRGYPPPPQSPHMSPPRSRVPGPY